jgi:hypothetical protein
MVEIINSRSAAAEPFRRCFGFDSFEGLPEELLDNKNREEWKPGAFNIAQRLGVSPDDAYRIVLDKVSEHHKDVVFIKGFYDEILNDDIVAEYDMGKALFLEIDCDIFSSAKVAMQFMFKNNLMTFGTVIYFDDYGGTMDKYPEYEAGESKAWKEIVEEYSVKYETLYKVGTAPHIGVGVRILDYNIGDLTT